MWFWKWFKTLVMTWQAYTPYTGLSKEYWWQTSIENTKSEALPSISNLIFLRDMIQKKRIFQDQHNVVKLSDLSSKCYRKGFWKQPHTKLMMWEHHIDYCFFYNRYWPVHQRGSADVRSPWNHTDFKHEKFVVQSPLIQKTAEHLKGNKICSVVNVISAEPDFDW